MSACSALTNLILVSSPLQALVVSLLLRNEKVLRQGLATVCVEGDCCVSLPSSNMHLVRLRDTRGPDLDAIRENLMTVLNEAGRKCRLWVSDPFWPLNNAAYATLLTNKRLLEVNFFDEGMVLYTLERMSLPRFFREQLKFLVLSCQTSLAFKGPSLRPFYGNSFNGDVFALNPELLQGSRQVRKVLVDVDTVREYENFAVGSERDADLNNIALCKKPVLLLGQPYYRVSDESSFSALLKGAVEFMQASSYDGFFVKLHPSEGDDVFQKYYKPLGFRRVFDGAKSPIEAILNRLPVEMALVSFNSSALLNAGIFGFRGEVISYGMDWVAKRYPFRSSLFRLQEELFEKKGVKVFSDVLS